MKKPICSQGYNCPFLKHLIKKKTLEGLRKAKLKGIKLGRPFAAKDKIPRRKDGYFTRYKNYKKGIS